LMVCGVVAGMIVASIINAQEKAKPTQEKAPKVEKVQPTTEKRQVSEAQKAEKHLWVCTKCGHAFDKKGKCCRGEEDCIKELKGKNIENAHYFCPKCLTAYEKEGKCEHCKVDLKKIEFSEGHAH